MKILVAESSGFSDTARENLARLGRVELADLDASELATDGVDHSALADACSGADVVFVRLRNRLDRAFFEGSPGLRVVVTPTTGLDHVDLEAAEAAGVAVLSLRGETEFLQTVTATAEHTWGLLLALVRRIPEASASAARGEWDRDRFRGREIKGGRLGIVGLGRLGSMVARYGRAFGMEVAAYDPHLDVWPAGVRRCAGLLELAAASDVLTLHVPLRPDTRGLVDEGVIRALPSGAVVLNTARGGVLDEAALLAALDDGHLAGAALDVLDGETAPEGVAAHPLVQYASRHANLLLTPHLGGATLESMRDTEIFMAGKLERWMSGEEVRVDAGPVRGPVGSSTTADDATANPRSSKAPG